MTELQREGRRLHRVVGRGRDEAAPVYAQLAVLLVVAAVVGLLVGVSFAVYYLV
jgi:hypothetical protein